MLTEEGSDVTPTSCKHSGGNDHRVSGVRLRTDRFWLCEAWLSVDTGKCTPDW